MPLYGLTQADRDKLKGMLANVNAGKKGPSRRPVATRRRQVIGGGDKLRVAIVTESGGIPAATLASGDIVPTSGDGEVFTRPATITDNWPDTATVVTLVNLSGDDIDENAYVLIDKQGLIVNQFCTPPA